jgi:hypothetical protein
MSFEIKPGTGFLSPNQKHKAGDKLPCLSGHANIGGVDYKVALWAPKPGKKAYFMTLNIPEQTTEEKKPEPKKEVLPEVIEAPPEVVQQKLSNIDF